MSHQFDQFVRASIQERYIIFGVTLRPLSLGHVLLMKRLGCAFAEESESTGASIMDLLVAVSICCRKYQEFLDWYNDDDARNSWITKWYKSIRKESRNKGWALMNKFSLFNMYRKEGVDVPLFFDEEGKMLSYDINEGWEFYKLTCNPDLL